MWCGLFVGGRARRMQGAAKGLLSIEGEPVVARTARVVRTLGLTPVWVGLEQSAHASAYRAALPGLHEVPDAPAGVGPLGGLAGLLASAREGPVLALACDMPFVSAALLRRLVDEAPDARVLAPRRAGLWEPLCARYDATLASQVAAELAAGTRSFQHLLPRLAARELSLREPEAAELVDWDRPEDVGAPRGRPGTRY